MPVDYNSYISLSFSEFLFTLFWLGNGHALWFLWGSIVGILILWIFGKYVKSHTTIFIISILILFGGCLKTSWSPLFRTITGISLPDYLDCRNGLYYAFPYMALGMLIAKQESIKNIKKSLLGFFVSVILLVIESTIFVVYYKTQSTILWMSVIPAIYYLIQILMNINIIISKKTSLVLRKLSILIYVSHGMFLILFSHFEHLAYFFTVSLSSIIFSLLIIKLSNKISFFKYLY